MIFGFVGVVGGSVGLLGCIVEDWILGVVLLVYVCDLRVMVSEVFSEIV